MYTIVIWQFFEKVKKSFYDIFSIHIRHDVILLYINKYNEKNYLGENLRGIVGVGFWW